MRVIAILETYWNWRGMASAAGYKEEAPRYFRINPENFSGRRLYKLCGPNAQLLVTNACRNLVSSPKEHGIPDPIWLRENLTRLEDPTAEPPGVTFDVLLVCGKVAQATFKLSGYTPRAARVIEIPHPAARTVWTREYIDRIAAQIQNVNPG
jgi:hypothetical protein